VNNLPYAGALCVIALVLAGCNSSTSTAYRTLSLAISGPESSISAEQVNRLGRPGLLATYGLSETLLVLANRAGTWAEWHGPQQMLVTRNGRLVQTAGIPDKGDVLAPLLPDDPFLGDLRSLNGQEITRNIDMPARFLTNIPQHARYRTGPMEMIEIMGVERELQRVDEAITMPSIGFSTINYYWVDPATGTVLASAQHLADDLPVLYLTEVVPSTVEPQP
tara:strand:- start:19769 stop:20431 length:663 start_codon:yes stop_codon:yes gene_type:complete